MILLGVSYQQCQASFRIRTGGRSNPSAGYPLGTRTSYTPPSNSAHKCRNADQL